MLIFAIVCAVLVALLLAGRVYQQIGTARDLRRHPAPGKFVDAGGRQLHALTMGEGGTTVVFESGLMSTVLSWRDIQPEIAKTARTFSYDRAGLGWSEAGAVPRDAERIATELHALLENMQVPPPYILVGHSFGGLTTRVFTGRYPDQVAGLVLLDPVVAAEWHPVGEQNQRRIRIGTRILRRASGLSRWGVLRFVSMLLRSGIKPLAEPLVRLMSKGAPKGDGTTKSPLFWNLPPSERSMAHVFWVQPKFTETIASQLENLPASAAQALAAGEALRHIPVFVVSAADASASRLADHEAIARASSSGKHFTAKEGGHWVMVDEPDLVLQAIREVVEMTSQTHRAKARA